jgi:tRNA pseudouridine38-40 synthase
MSSDLKIIVSYDGTDFVGWQIQKAGRTVQGEVLKALERMHKHPVKIHAAGRTDSGVHAHGQVINFHSDIASIDPQRFCVALNSYLPADIRARSSRAVDGEFHARYSALRRTYRYHWKVGSIVSPQEHRFYSVMTHTPSVSRLNRLCRPLVGTHDYSTFTLPTEPSENRVRTVYGASFFPLRGKLVFQITANAFLWRMVRSIAGTIVELDKMDAEGIEVERRLSACDHAASGPSAPARGLFLHHVEYADEYM